MVDKAVSGIGRELRYFEYKFRKNQQKKKKKDKNGNLTNQDLAWTDSTPSSDLQSTSEEVRKAAPSSSGEEALQIQVALAMSREEEQERDRQSESDRLRLELAIKESQDHAEYVKKADEVKSQPSLLDLSLSAPRPTGATSSQFPTQQAIPAAANDPWGSSAPSSVSFDPFTNQKPAVVQANAPPAMPLHSTNITTADPWGMAAQTQIGVSQQITTQPATQDPWGATPTAAVAAPTANPWGNVTQPAAPGNIPQSNGWGAATAPVQQPAQSQMGAWGVMENPPSAPANRQNGAWGMQTSTPSTISQSGAWGNPDPFLSLSQPQEAPKPTYDPFSGTSSVAQTQSPAMYSAPATSNPSNAGFGSPHGGDIFSAPPFDPLKDFDNLHIGSNELEPVVLTNDLTPGASVAKDLFPATQTLQPNPAPQNINGAPVMQAASNSNPHSSFLGENSSLVNLDSGWRYQAPYNTKPLGSSSHNPFQQTGPSRTLNEMMGRQSGFQ